ncbi:KipI family sensor histidine kinase inhibitor [Paucibacter oligotrophus]|uniref:KipI family sensor histidine kinase inhibitor n=1 Tax=Roseateles oligotrophus TaxID=1769250 RepID=A0A840LEK3_9BURK|nr:urea amidolyase family protein [Roseateles oligotrophus]MBB4846121.1 KipI family sensor histidine kinase inhibitor [Roseateles oligotrophus]
MRFLPVNLDAMLVELADLAQTLALLASLQNKPLAGVEELVPGARTLLVRWRPAATTMARLREEILTRKLDGAAPAAGRLITIPVHYQGEDLAELAALLGISAAEVIARHTGAEYSVAFTGFAPGFAYLSGGHASFDNIPRRATPRTRIPAGAVGLAGRFSGIYPQASPGGWQIIGQTPEAMWDLSRAQPALLQPGDRVRFVDIAKAGYQAAPATAPAPSSAVPGEASASALEVLATGLQTLIQDLGRHGLAGQGVAASGAMDQAALKRANRLVGNASNTAALEAVGGGLQLRSRGETVVAVTGASLALTLTEAKGRSWSVPSHQALALADGDTLSLGAPSAGLRSYLAARGGFCITPVLGSCATDTLARIGPPPLAVGDVLGLRAPANAAVVGWPETPPAALPRPQDTVTLDIVLGPRDDWFSPAALALLCSQAWQVTPQSNRVGLRLQGELRLERSVQQELPSEGTAWGAIQVPANGQPVLFLADHPLTGGYPVIANVASYHLDLAGQMPVHAWVRFNQIGVVP